MGLQAILHIPVSSCAFPMNAKELNLVFPRSAQKMI